MIRAPRRELILVLATLLMAACGSAPFVKDELTAEELAADAQVGVLPINYLEKPSVDVHDNVIGLAGTAGKVALVKGRDTKRRKFHSALEEQRYAYQQQTNEVLIERLAEAGIDAEFMDFRRSIDNILEAVPPRRFEKRYPQETGYSVLLDIYVDYVGYAAVGLDDPYLPTVHIAARLVDAGTLDVVYESMIQYNPLEVTGEETVIEADPAYQFKNFDAIIADVERAKNGLAQAVSAVLDTLVAEIDTH